MSVAPSIETLPTVVLVGGRVTLTDGSELDSRQVASDDESARAVQAALTGSAEWWTTVASVVDPTLDDAVGGFSVVLGRRSVLRAAPHGETRRSGTRKILRGRVGSVSVVRSGIGEGLPSGYQRVARLHSSRGDDMGSVGVRFDDPTPRWCFVDGNEYYLRMIARHLGARVLVDTTGELLSCADGVVDTGTLSVEYVSSSRPPEFIVAPDTPSMRDRVQVVLAGRPRRTQEAGEPAGPSSYVAGAPREPPKLVRLPVLRAQCSVTGLVRGGCWEDALDLDAARMLLLRRFDLKLGLWDLALNPVLRSTVLSRSPEQQTPEELAQIPAQARKLAGIEADKSTARRAARQQAVDDVTATLRKNLAPSRWRIDAAGRLFLPLTEPLSNWPDAPKYPLVLLRIELNKSSVRVLVWQWFYNDLDINAFVESRRAAFDAVAPLPSSPAGDRSSVPLWTAAIGWGEADADWSGTAKAVARHAEQWVALLADFVASCRDIRGARFSKRS